MPEIRQKPSSDEGRFEVALLLERQAERSADYTDPHGQLFSWMCGRSFSSLLSNASPGAGWATQKISTKNIVPTEKFNVTASYTSGLAVH